MKQRKQYRVRKECGLYYIETSKDRFDTCVSVGVATDRKKAEAKMKVKRNTDRGRYV